MRKLDLRGMRFGRLTAVSPAEAKNNRTRWNCVCDCGTTGVHTTGDLRGGDSKSCGCLPPNNLVHGHNRMGARTRTYRIWAGMLSRCTSPTCKDYRFYGAKGIRVCERWITFANFLADMGESTGDMTIDRIDEKGDYEPSNCQWLPHADNVRKANAVHRRMTFQTLPEPVAA